MGLARTTVYVGRTGSGRRPRRNALRKSSFRGVVWSGGRWVVEVRDGNETIFLGRFIDEVAAARQYDRGARLLFGDRAVTNASLGLL